MRRLVIILSSIFIFSITFFSLAYSLEPPAEVRDGMGADIDFTGNSTSYSANWDPVDFSEAENGQHIRYEIEIGYYIGGDFITKDSSNYETVYPDVPQTSITKSYSLQERNYIIRVRSGKYIESGPLPYWDYSSWRDSDGFTVDVTPPSVQFQPINSTQSSATFLLSWSGTDVSGIAHYDVQYRIGSGQWMNLLVNTTRTSTTFTGNNGQTYQFRIRAEDIVGNVGDYTTPVQTTIQSTGVSISVAADPSGLTFNPGETEKNIALSVTATGPGSVTLNQIQEVRENSEIGTETLSPEFINQTVNSGSTITLNKVVHLSSAQRAIYLSTSTKSFNLTINLSGVDSFGNSISASVIVPVQVSELPASGLVINDVTVTLPQSPYYVGDVIEDARVTIDATGSGTVEGQILIDDSTDWNDNPGFSVNVNNSTTFTINGNIPTDSPGDHTLKVEITSPVQFTKEVTYTISNETPPFPPKTLVLVKDVAELTNLDGTAVATTATGPNGYVEYKFNGTAKMKLLSLNNKEVEDVTVKDLIVRYENENPTKAKIRGGTVEKEVEEGYITDFADGYLRIKKVSFVGKVSPATDYIKVDATFYWKAIKSELMDLGGFIVKKNGVEAKSFNIDSDKPKSFTAFGLTFKVHDVSPDPALVFGKDEANDRYYFKMCGSISMKEKKGTSTKDKTLTTYKNLTVYTDGDVEADITISKFDLIPDKVTLNKIRIRYDDDNNLKCKIKGTIHDLPSPLDKLPDTEFSIKFDKDGNVSSSIVVLKELKKGNKGHGLGNNDNTEWDVGIGKLDITYLGLYIQYDEGTLNKDHSELMIGLDFYLNLKNQDGSEPTPDQKRISFGELNQNEDFTGGIRVNFDGDFTWNNPTNATIITNKKLDLAVITIMIDNLSVQSDPFAFAFTGSILFDVSEVSGGINFENLIVNIDGEISNLSDSITGGNLSVMDVVQIDVADVNWSMTETDLTFKENQTQGEGENQTPQTGDKTIRVKNYFQILNASMSIGDGEGNTIMSGGFKEFTFYTPVNGSKSFVLKDANLSISEIELHADVEYSSNLLLFAGSLTMPGPEGDIEAIACGKLGIVNNQTTMGIFIAAAGLSIPVGPGVFLSEVGGGFFLNPIPDDLAMVRKIANFERPELNDSIEDMRPGGADNPGSFALMLLGGLYVSSPDVMSGRALATLTSNFFNLDAEVELTQGMLKGVAYFAIGWNPAYAEGAVDVELNYVDLISGNGSLDFYAYGSDAWGVMGNFNVKLLGSDLASGSVFVGNPGFMLEATVTSGIDLKVVSGSYSIRGMFWYYRTPDPDTFGAYGKVTAEGEFLEGLLGAKASLEGALMSVPSFIFYSVGSVEFKVCYVTVYSGSLWIAVSSHGFDGGKGRNKEYDGYIEEARNMADDLKQARAELENELEQAKVELAKLSEEQREAAGLALVERSGIKGALVQTAFRQNEVLQWGNNLPPKLQIISNRLFGREEENLVRTRNQLKDLDDNISQKIELINSFQDIVVDELKDYEELVMGKLPSVHDIGRFKDPFKGMQTKVVKNKNGKNITITVGFQIDESEAQSQRDKLNNLREDFAKYQDEFIKQAGIIDGSLQRLDEILFMNEGNLNQLVELYADTYHSMSEYIDKYVTYQVINERYAGESLNDITGSITENDIEALMEWKANDLINNGKANELARWNQSRINLIEVLVQAGGLEGYNPPEELTTESDQVELFKLTGKELWWEIPTKGFRASIQLSQQRRTEAIQKFQENSQAFDNKWSAASITIDNIYEKKAALYNILYEIYDELATYGTGEIGILDDGNACGFSGLAGAGLGFRTREVARSVASQGYRPPGDVVYPEAPTIGPLRPPVKMQQGTLKGGMNKGFNAGVNDKFNNRDYYFEPVKNINSNGLILAQAGEPDFVIAQAQVKVPKTAVQQASTGTQGVVESIISNININNKLPAYKNLIQRDIKDVNVKVPVKWVPVSTYFTAKRGEIAPYIEIPEIKSFEGNITSSTSYDATLNASVRAQHPISVVEYSYKIVPAEKTQEQSLIDKDSSDENVYYPAPYIFKDILYAGGVPDAGVEENSQPQQQQGISVGGVTGGLIFTGKLYIFKPWFSMGGINRIKDVFFADIHREGEYYIYVRVRGAGGYSIERRARVVLRYFNPETDNSPVVSSIDASDTTPPIKPVVQIDSPYTSNRHMIYAKWSSYDPESGIQKYEYGISHAGGYSEMLQSSTSGLIEPGITPAVEAIQNTPEIQQPQTEFVPDVLPWRNAGGRTEANIRRINLRHGNRYRVWVRATNGVGLKSVGASEPILVDTTPPPSPEIDVFERISLGYYANSLHFSYRQADDEESGIEHVFFAIGTDKDSDNIFEWTEVKSRDIKIANVNITKGEKIWLTVEAYNGAGIKSRSHKSLIVDYTDTTPPDSASVVTLPVGYTSKTDSITLGWNVVHDAESGVVKYEYGLGTNSNNPDVVPWRVAENVEKPVLLATGEEVSNFISKNKDVKGSNSQIGNNGKMSGQYKSSMSFVTAVTAPSLFTDFVQKLENLHLRSGVAYYAFVRVTNGAGLTSVAVSEPLTVDTTPPSVRLTAPETVNLSMRWELSLTIDLKDDESGVVKYMYAIWRMEEISSDSNIDGNLYVSAGYFDMFNNFVIASAPKPKTDYGVKEPKVNVSPEVESGKTTSNAGSKGVLQLQPELKKQPSVEYQFNPFENIPPWVRSEWIMITSGVPPKGVRINLKIREFPDPGLKGNERYRVKVWAINGAGVIGESNSVVIKTISIEGIEQGVNVSPEAAQQNQQILVPLGP